jgi:succinyl-CoA synthetase alpha subunit
MGHAGALVGAERETAAAKLAALAAGGARIARDPEAAITILGELCR